MAADLMKKSLAKCYREIAKLIAPTDNSILVLDYTYCILENDKLVEIKSYYFNSIPGYNELLQEFIRDNGNSIGLKKGRNVIAEYKSVKNKFASTSKAEFDTYESPRKGNFKVTSIHAWHRFCEAKGLGGFLMTVFYKVSPNHTIGIYVVLEKNIKSKSLILEIKDIIKDYLMTEGWSITYEIVTKTALRSLLQSDKGVEKAYDLELNNLRIHKIEVDHNAHTIFNILPDSLLGIDKIKKGIKKILTEQSPLYEQVAYEQKRLELTNIILQIISQKEVEQFKGKSISEILSMLDYYEPTGKAVLELQSISAVDFIPAKNNSYNSNANKAFMILWNFWHNASQYSFDKFYVTAFQEEGKLNIRFVNLGDCMHQDNCLFLMNRRDRPVSIRGLAGGLNIAREAMKELNWIVTSATTSEDKKTGLWENKIDLLIQKSLS